MAAEGKRAEQTRPRVNESPRPAMGERPRISAAEVERLIRESAYYRAEARGFIPGQEMRDWLEAEAEVRRRIGSSTTA